MTVIGEDSMDALWLLELVTVMVDKFAVRYRDVSLFKPYVTPPGDIFASSYPPKVRLAGKSRR